MKIKETDFIFLLSVLIIDGSDNADYFIYKFNISKKDQNRLKNIDNFYREKVTAKSFMEKDLNKICYYQGNQSVVDILSYKLFNSKKIDNKMLQLIDKFKNKVLPAMPVGAKDLMKKFKIPEGKNLGNKLKIIEEEWVNNNFHLTEKQMTKIINS